MIERVILNFKEQQHQQKKEGQGKVLNIAPHPRIKQPFIVEEQRKK